jgi:hypothetical protein
MLKKTLRSLVLALVMAVLSVSPVMAQDPPAEPPIFDWNLGASGDIVYLFNGPEPGFQPAVGFDIASIKQDLIKIRLNGIWTNDLDFDMPEIIAVGGGLTVIRTAEELAKLLNTEISVSEFVRTLAPTIGVLAGYNFSSENPDLEEKFVYGAWVSMISVKFDNLPFIE